MGERDDTRYVILQRRAAFVSASLAALAGCPSTQERPTSASPIHIHEPETASTASDQPQSSSPALTVAVPPDPSDGGLGVGDGDIDAGSPQVVVRVCLSIIKPPPVGFPPHSDQPIPSTTVMLDDVAQLMQQRPDLRVEIQGHTDVVEGRGRAGLGRRRAIVVQKYLVKRGVKPDRFCIVDHGSSRPVAPSGTAQGRASNRRTEFRALSPNEACKP